MDEKSKIPAYGLGWRHFLASLAFFGFFMTYVLRVNMNVALVAMVNQTALQQNHQEQKNQSVVESSSCLSGSGSTNSSSKAQQEHKYETPSLVRAREEISDGGAMATVRLLRAKRVIHVRNVAGYVEGPFVWDEQKQSLVLASFYYGYVLTQLPGGWLADRIGGKWVLGVGLMVTSVMTLLTPAAADLGIGSLMAVRIIEGLAEGVLFPAMHSMWGKWVPPLERSKLPAIAYTGPYVGTVVTFAVSGFVAASSWGWPAIFYISGTAGVLWCILWFIFVSNTPKDHRWISKAEFDYIDRSIQAEHSSRKQMRGCSDIPWWSMARSLPLISICVCHFCSNWGFYTLLNFLPTYFRTILGYDIRANGLLSALPYLGAAVVQIVVSQIADFLRDRNYASTTTVRKFCEVSENLSQGLCLLCVTFVGCNRTAIIVLLFFGVCLRSICISGYNVNHLDIAPIYAGILYGISNFCANITGFVTPSVVAAFTANNQTQSAWNRVFYVTTSLTWFAAVFYLIFGSGNVQSWARDEEKAVEEDKNSLKLSVIPVEKF